ncbi:aminotransferase class I/II-fold pyridoxal phosphate-dependent enzyme [Allofournierella sp.]|uniref:methionine gamma-lyase family protein n=1 Tax=Allofournierella sp. TaxID=1940256 RepID=UPI003AB35F25
MLEQFYDFSARLLELDQKAMGLCRPEFEKIDAIRDYNQVKMLKAFTENRVAATHLAGTTGYGYDDAGRDKLDRVFAQAVGAEDALCRPHFLSGTHALTVALFGLLRAGDTLLAATGRPYDTLEGVIGIDGAGKGCGSLAEFGVKYDEAPLRDGGLPDYELIAQKAREARVCHIQRSRGYSSRAAFDLETIGKVARTAKQANPEILVMVDNCYGEFTQTAEPVSAGADLMVGSLIKNGGGGIAPTGGYIAGRADLVERCGHRLTAPGTGRELGCTLDTLRQLYLGLYYAPGVTAEAVKTSIYSSCLLELLGKEPTPRYTAPRNDIITSFEAGSPEALVAFCQGIQRGSPVDSFVRPEPYAMAGYANEVIMAAGAFTEGSSIELSCDGPMRAPYTVYLQGGLNFAASRAGVLLAVQKAFEKEL